MNRDYLDLLTKKKDSNGVAWLSKEERDMLDRVFFDFAEVPDCKTMGQYVNRRTLISRELGMLDSEMADLIWRLACQSEHMEETEKKNGWPARSGKVILRIATRELISFCGD